MAIPENSCEDTDPVGDGWGWDGVTSCRVVPAANTFNEIEEIEEHFGVVSMPRSFVNPVTAAVIECPAFGNAGSDTFYLTYDGRLFVDSARSSRTRFGLWSTGISMVDNALRMSIEGTYNQFNITEDSISLNSAECRWIEP